MSGNDGSISKRTAKKIGRFSPRAKGLEGAIKGLMGELGSKLDAD
jgi:hypothetical protein